MTTGAVWYGGCKPQLLIGTTEGVYLQTLRRSSQYDIRMRDERVKGF